MPESRIYEAVGRFSVEFELMCQEMEDCIQAVLYNAGLTNVGLINVVLAEKTAEPLRSLMFPLLAETLPKGQDTQKLLSKCSKQIQDVTSMRNDIIHSKWLVVSDGRGFRQRALAHGKKLKANKSGDATKFQEAEVEYFQSAIEQCKDAQETVQLLTKCANGYRSISDCFSIQNDELKANRDALRGDR